MNGPEPRPRRRRDARVILIILILIGVGWFVGQLLSLRPSKSPVGAPKDARAPEGVRIKVEVLNATKTTGLARKATQYLRDRGFDVVGSGNVAEQRSKTVVYDRSAHPKWAALVGKAMEAPVLARPDTSRYLDVTVLIGADWHPPALPFHP